MKNYLFSLILFVCATWPQFTMAQTAVNALSSPSGPDQLHSSLESRDEVSIRSIGLYGLALPTLQATVRSSIAGRIKQVHVREGQHVEQGDLLVELEHDVASAEAAIADLQAEESGVLMRADSELRFARENYQRTQRLFQDKAVSEFEFKQAAMQLENAEAGYQIQVEQRAAQQARLRLAQAQLQQYFVTAPFDGQVIHLGVNQGDSIVASSEILELASLERLQVEIYLPMQQANNLQVGQTVSLTVENSESGRTIPAQAIFRSPMIEATTGTMRCVFEIDNRTLRLPAGISVSLIGALDTPRSSTRVGTTPRSSLDQEAEGFSTGELLHDQ